MNTFLTWLGSTDLKCATDNNEAAIATIAFKNTKPFDRIVILASAWEGEWDDYVTWLKTRLVKDKRLLIMWSFKRFYSLTCTFGQLCG
jgi:hypothetical protein